MYVVAGLGNPGSQYALNRHNIGFMAVDVIADQYQFPPFKTKFNAAISEGKIGNHRVVLCKPLTYMNLSGRPIGELLHFYKLPLEKLYVIHDDLDLLPGSIKIKQGGGHGGHNGLRSIDGCVGQAYCRLRLGIGHPGIKEAVSGYVLSNFKGADEGWLTDLLSAIAAEIDTLFDKDPGQWLTKVHLRLA